jgi:hypothetical protein
MPAPDPVSPRATRPERKAEHLRIAVWAAGAPASVQLGREHLQPTSGPRELPA